MGNLLQYVWLGETLHNGIWRGINSAVSGIIAHVADMAAVTSRNYINVMHLYTADMHSMSQRFWYNQLVSRWDARCGGDAVCGAVVGEALTARRLPAAGRSCIAARSRTRARMTLALNLAMGRRGAAGGAGRARRGMEMHRQLHRPSPAILPSPPLPKPNLQNTKY
uniref:Uncharacterized protein n=1 Tax=Heliothis virescens TaxID=7102 RepID=A0A2A4JBC9_HELVI